MVILENMRAKVSRPTAIDIINSVHGFIILVPVRYKLIEIHLFCLQTIIEKSWAGRGDLNFALMRFYGGIHERWPTKTAAFLQETFLLKDTV